jgi:hypothetical protein
MFKKGVTDGSRINRINGSDVSDVSDVSGRLLYKDYKYNDHGYQVEIYNDYIGNYYIPETSDEIREKTKHGSVIKIKNPFNFNCDVGVTNERIVNINNDVLPIQSSDVAFGPFIKPVPGGGVSSMFKVLGGVKRYISPFASLTLTTKQFLKLPQAPFLIALKQVLYAGSNTIPTHENRNVNNMMRIRGGTPLSDTTATTKALSVTAELRLPLDTFSYKIANDASIVLFTDGYTTLDYNDASIGIGGRLSVAGIPLKYDVTVDRDKEIKSHFSVAHDFVL